MRQAVLGERGGVGATDLATAFGAATSWLAGTDAAHAYVVYLGDGVVTGGARDLAPLRATLAGKATFVGFGVGDGADVPTMSVLADATAGLVVSVDPADDLGWRALDTVATLYTPRVVGLVARAVDATGRPVEGAIAYLRGRQIADGDEVEVAVRAPVGAAIAAVTLDGTRDGKPWTRTVALAGAERPAGAGYLPRIWAHRHITTLMLERNTAPAPQPCAGEPCPTYEEQRVAHREVLRKEIVALGKQYFLLSPHTSLIVLENDAMYAQYGVDRDPGRGWAPYETPAKIATGPVAPPVALGNVDNIGIVRTPTDAFYRYDQHGWNEGLVLEDTENQRWFALDLASSAGVLRGGVATQAATTSSDAPALPDPSQLERNTISTVPVTGSAPSGTGSGFGVGGGGVAAGPRRESRSSAIDEDAASSGRFADSLSQPIAAAEVADLTIMSTEQLAGQDNNWAVGDTRTGGVLYKADKSRRKDLGGRGRGNAGGGGTPYPVAYHNVPEPRLDDVTELVPAFGGDPLDGAIGELRAAAGGATGRIDDDARRMLADARARLAPGVYRWGDGPEISVDATGRMAWQVTHDSGLREIVTFDGATLRRAYPELGLVFTRAIGDASPALVITALPLMAFDPDHLARWYVVTRKDAHTLALAPASAPDAPTLELELDDDHRVVALRGADGRALIAVRYRGGAPIGATVFGDAVDVAYAPAAITDATAAVERALGVEVTLPVRPPAYWRGELAKLTGGAGSDAWRRLQRQLLAAQVTTRDPQGALATLRELVANGGIALGDLALGSAGLAYASDADAVTLMAAAGEPAVALGRYLAASRAYRKKPRVGVFAPSLGDGLLGALARHRETLAYVEADKLDGALTSLAATPTTSMLKVIAAARIAQQWSWRSSRAAEAWELVAQGAWRNVARYEAARTLYNKGDYAAAGDRFAELLTSYDLAAMPAALDWTAKSAITSSRRGQVGWQRAWTAYRTRLLGSDRLADVMTLLSTSTQLGEGDLDRVVGRASDLAAGDLDAQAAIIEHALQYGQLDRAVPLLDAALARGATPALHRLAAQVAERQGRVAAAADHLEQALDGEADGGTPLAQFRADMQRLLAMRGRLAVIATGAARDAGVAAALVVANRWRELDPDNAAVDRQIGELLLAAGQPEEAWRQLSTAIERHPTDGDGWALVAEVMEKEGRLDDALGYWQQAVVIDQTNPTWRLRRAQTLYALGRDAEALAQLEDIHAIKWHQRWWNITYQVDQLIQQAKPKVTPAPTPTPPRRRSR